MSSSSVPVDLSALLGAAQAEGNLSSGGLDALSINDLGQTIQAGLGVSVDDAQSSEAINLYLVVDDSTSIRMAGNTDVVREGVNLILESLAKTKQASSVYAYCIQLNRGIIYPLSPLIDGGTGKLDDRLRLTSSNYSPSGGTPLFDNVIVACGTAVAKIQEFSVAGVPARSIIVVITDGENFGGTKIHPESCEPVITDLLRKEMHIVAFMGIDDGRTAFHDIATRMGIRSEWILTPKSDPSSIRHAFAMVSQSAVRASQAAATGANFSQVAPQNQAGGFGG